MLCRDWMAGREGPAVPRPEVMEAVPGQLRWREAGCAEVSFSAVSQVIREA